MTTAEEIERDVLLSMKYSATGGTRQFTVGHEQRLAELNAKCVARHPRVADDMLEALRDEATRLHASATAIDRILRGLLG